MPVPTEQPSNQIKPLLPKPNRISKSTMSSFFLLPTSSQTGSSSSFLGLGCTTSASQQVSVPAVIRSSADWDYKSKKTKKKKKNYNGGSVKILTEVDRTGWCGPGVGFSTDAVSVDPVERNVPVRRKIDNNNINNHNQREVGGGSVLLPRRFQNRESNPYFDVDSASRAELSERYHRHLRQSYHDGIAEALMRQNGFVMGGMLSAHDHFRDLRLNIDNMTYEQLLELGDKIGYVNTGLTEKQIKNCLRKVKPFLAKTPVADRKCCICQEEYNVKDNVGKLQCGHRFHIDCVKEWLMRKNNCPVCKTVPTFKSLD